jgi:membrane protease YdiL (CAAX protease family)
MMSRRSLLTYLGLVFALGWCLQLGAIATVGDPEKPAALPWLAGAMFAPALVTLAFVVFDRRLRGSVAWRPRWRMAPLLVVAFVVPTLIAFSAVAVVQIAGWGHAGWFAFSRGGVGISGGPWVLGRGDQTWPLFVVNVAATGALFSAVSALEAVGEELGWRGFLQGQLIERLGLLKGIALVGLIWALWHLPLLLAGYNYPDHPLLGALVLFPIELIAASFFLGWLTLRSGSFWPAAVAHGAVNSIEQGVLGNLCLSVPHLYEDGLQLAFTVIVGVAFCIILAAGKPIRAEGVIAPSVPA